MTIKGHEIQDGDKVRSSNGRLRQARASFSYQLQSGRTVQVVAWKSGGHEHFQLDQDVEVRRSR